MTDKIYCWIAIVLQVLVGLDAANYPQCWIKYGECLDDNEGPLVMNVKPNINKNIIDSAVSDVESLDDCVDQCLKNDQCRYFTWYPDLPPQKQLNETTCLLVGYNLRHACFKLTNVCVLMKECLVFNDTCPTCQTGMRPLVDITKEPETVILSGLTDNRDYKAQMVRQYSLQGANVNEVLHQGNATCLLSNTGLLPRMGSASGYVNQTLMLCGGFTFDDSTNDDDSMSNGSYVSGCQKYSITSKSWLNAANLTTQRAFPSSAVVQTNSKQKFYLLGGYNRQDGFLDSVESYDSQTDSWTDVADMKLPRRQSHFCSVVIKEPSGSAMSLFIMGGWSMSYSKAVYRMSLDDQGRGNSSWHAMPDMNVERSEHACALVQLQWRIGIMVAGGYGQGAWLDSVEFFDLNMAKWYSLDTVVGRLNQGRHYLGLTTISLTPLVFAGWSNGSLSHMETMDFCQEPPQWVTLPRTLRAAREKFAFALVPNGFHSNCL